MKIDSETVRAMMGGIAEGFEEYEEAGLPLTLEQVALCLPSMFLQTIFFDSQPPAEAAILREQIMQQLQAGIERIDRNGQPVRLN